jgi:hypothetical protein
MPQIPPWSKFGLHDGIPVTPITAAESRPGFVFFRHDRRAGATIVVPGEAESGSAGTAGWRC